MRAHSVAVALTIVAVLLGAFLWLGVRSPSYEASVEVLVTPLPEGDTTFIGIPFLISSGSDPTRTIQTAATLVDSAGAAEATARELGDGLTTDAVAGAVTVTPKGESNVLEVTATAGSPGMARDLANTFATRSLRLRSEMLRQQLDTTIGRLQASAAAAGGGGAELSARITALQNVRDGNDPTLSIAQPATLPTAPLGTSAMLVLILAVGVGGILGVGLALALEVTGRRVSDEAEIRALYPLPVLTRVPRLPRRTLEHAERVMPPAVREAFRTLQARMEVRDGRRRTIMVTSPSRNDGKTSTAINLAMSLLATGQDVLLIDFDLRKPDVAARLGITDASGGLTALLAGAPLEDVTVFAPRMPMLRVVPAIDAHSDVVRLETLLEVMPRVLQEAAELADYVIVDTAPVGEVADAVQIAGKVDDVLLVTRPGHTNRVNLEQARDLLGGLGTAPTGLVMIGELPGGSSGYYNSDDAPDRRPGRLARLLPQ